MVEVAVDHPEVDERLYVAECVIRVACPQWKMKAGVPCQGARFKWLKLGTRKGFRYTQETHYARRHLFQAWKAAGRPRRYPEDVYERFVATHGKFSKVIDHKAVMPERRKRVRRKSTTRRRRASSRPSAEQLRRAPMEYIEHKGCVWEGIEGNQLWTWCPYREFRNFTFVSVFDFPEHLGGVKLNFEGYEHRCESREAAFDLAIELVTKAALLSLFNERIEWRIEELERRFGHLLGGSDG